MFPQETPLGGDDDDDDDGDDDDNGDDDVVISGVLSVPGVEIRKGLGTGRTVGHRYRVLV